MKLRAVVRGAPRLADDGGPFYWGLKGLLKLSSPRYEWKTVASLMNLITQRICEGPPFSALPSFSALCFQGRPGVSTDPIQKTSYIGL
ncbi:hypothetical protein BR93DRAFT_925905 [Coniochaeta sp. PMI_546]|nr:hypothetical protein BR93DRAFT_925905 [Coniochaeta sp. PMI_546]